MITIDSSINRLAIHRVPASRPFVWLAEGWQDLLHHRRSSLAYGCMVSAFGALVFAYSQHPVFIAAVVVAFLFAGPMLGAGLCELSRCQDEGEPVDFQSSLLGLRRNRKNLLAFSATLALVAATWLSVSAFFIYGLTGSIAPSVASTVWGDVLRQVSATQLATYTLVGGSLACAVFMISVVSVPVIIDRHVNDRTAIRTSLRVTARDLPAMAVWALLILALVLLGFATMLVGMVVIFPLLGHASWRAYRELVEH